MNKYTLYGLVTITALLGTAQRLTRKVVMKSMTNYSIIIVDTIITGIALIITGLYLGGTEQLIKDLAKLRGFTLLAFVAAAACVTISSVIALNLIRTEKLSYLVIVSTGVGIIATIASSAIFLGDEITKTKLLSIPFLLTGVYLAR
jgi:multidrug transporter EmrE-like cation transporter